jgi:hypothetical protein
MAKPTYGSYEPLKKLHKSKRAKFDAEELELIDRLVAVHNEGLRAVVDGVVGLKAPERKAYIAPYVELGKSLDKKMKPNSRGYMPPPRGLLKSAAGNYPVFLGWLKNRHKYREGELAPAVSRDELATLEQALREKSGNSEFLLSDSFCDCFSVCGGMHPHVRTDPMGGLTLFRLNEVLPAYEDMLKRFSSSSGSSSGYPLEKMTPLSEDGAGNLYAVWGNDVYDCNHEDGSVMPMGVLPKLIAKAHKVTR